MRKNIHVLCFFQGMQKQTVHDWNKPSYIKYSYFRHLAVFITTNGGHNWGSCLCNKYGSLQVNKIVSDKKTKLFQFQDSQADWDALADTQEKAITSSLVILATVSFAGLPHSTKMRVRWSMAGQNITLRSALSQVTEQRRCWT